MENSDDWNKALLLKLNRLTADKNEMALDLIPQLKLTDNKKRYHFAETLRGLERYEEALEKYQEYQPEVSKVRVKRRPMELGYLNKPLGIFLCLIELGRYEEALKPLRKITLIASNPDAVYETIFIRVLEGTKQALEAGERIKAGKHLDALRKYEELLFGFRPTPPTLEVWSELLLRLGRKEEAGEIMDYEG